MDAFLHLELILQAGAASPSGVLVRAGHEQVSFSGYLELLAAIERVTTDSVSGPRSTEQRGAS